MEKFTFCWLEVGAGRFGAVSSSAPSLLPMCLWRSSHSCHQGLLKTCDLAKAGCCFPTDSHVVSVSEIRGEERRFPRESCPLPVCLPRSFVQLLGFAMAIIKASLGNHYCTLGAQERAAGCPRWTSGSFTCVYTSVARTPRLPVVPRAPSPCVLLGQSLLLGGRSAKCCYVFTLRRQGQVYIVRMEPSFPQLADISALMRVQSSRRQSTCWEKEGKGVRGDVLDCVSALLKVTIYIGLPSSSAAGRWSQQCLLAMCRGCARGVTQRRSGLSCFFCTKEVPSPPLQELKANARTRKFSSTLLIALSLHGLTILQVVPCVCFVLLCSALLNICINKIR